MYSNIISPENLFIAWEEFLRGKRKRKDVAEFSMHLAKDVFILHEDLKGMSYMHGPYKSFGISDPKPRSIHKATVRDRLLHHAIYRVLYPLFDKRFIYDSYSCRHLKGTHRALDRFNHFLLKASLNNSRTCWILKCDIKKFFASIDQATLLQIVGRHIADEDVLWLIGRVVASFQSTNNGKGLPLGNLTSQLLVNVYMNEFDQFVKHELKQKYYIRYADDFIIMHHDRDVLIALLFKARDFLSQNLKLSLHPNKIFLKTASSGVDFLGWIHFPYRRVLRTSTKKRMLKKLRALDNQTEVLNSYFALLNHGNAHILREKILRN